jgi:ABC-type uncharacterized transport system involved in gliding motility auxiliary subunit
MKRTDKIIGLLGGIVFLFSLIYYSIQNIWGTINWITLILGLAGSGYFLYIYYSQREKRISKRSLQYGSNVLVQIIIVIAILGLLAFITTKQHLRNDLTKNKLYSLADQTDKVVNGLDKEVNIIAFYRASDQGGAKDLLDEYAFRSGKLNFEFVDPDEKPQIAKQYQIRQYNTVVVESGVKKETVEELSETNLTNAIIKVTREQDKVVYFITGHGERSISGEDQEGFKRASEAIENENHLVRELNLVRNIAAGKGIPDSCTLLAVVGPKASFFPAELDTIKSYLDQGGKALIMLDPEHPSDLADFLFDYHVTVGNDVVIDASGMGQLFGAGPGMPLVTGYDQSIPITKDFSIMTFYPLTCSISPAEEKGGYTIKELLKTSKSSWAETELQQGQASFDEGKDKPGPVTIAVLIEKEVGDKKTGIALFGDSDFVKNGYWNNKGNADLFLNTINYLAEEEDLISIRPKEIDDRRVTLTQADVKTLFYLVVIAIPVLVIIAGVVLYIRRAR